MEVKASTNISLNVARVNLCLVKICKDWFASPSTLPCTLAYFGKYDGTIFCDSFGTSNVALKSHKRS